MSTAYVPREGTTPYLAIEHLKTLPAGTRLTAPEIAEALGVAKTSISTLLRSAVDAGLIDAEKAGNRSTYSLPPPAEPDDGKLKIATFSDGDVSVLGGVVADDGSIMYTREQMEQLVLQVMRPHVTLGAAA